MESWTPRRGLRDEQKFLASERTKVFSSRRQIHGLLRRSKRGCSASVDTLVRDLCRWKRSQKTEQTSAIKVSRRFNQHVKHSLPAYGRMARPSERDIRVAGHQTFNSPTIEKYFWNRTVARHSTELHPCADVRIIDPFPLRRNKPILRYENLNRTTFASTHFCQRPLFALKYIFQWLAWEGILWKLVW